MDWANLVYDIVKISIFPLLGIATAYFVKWLKAKEKEVKTRTENLTAHKYIEMVFETVRDCVSATTQTYVQSLKAQGKFDLEAQKQAFKMSYDAVMAQLTEEAKGYLTSIYGDLQTYLTTKIEAEVKAQK